LAALIGSIFPANNDWQEPEDGIELFIETNGVHVSLIIPMQTAGGGLSDIIRPDALISPEKYGTHAMVGWGHEGVYRRGESWSDVQPGDIWDAATGSDNVLFHIYHRSNPSAAQHRRSFLVTPKQYKYIVNEIRSKFVLDADGRAAATPAYGDDDVFYDAIGHYSAFNTCNEWIASLLRRAGVRVGIWSPFESGVMRWFREPKTKSQ